jgi:hypothetical protein
MGVTWTFTVSAALATPPAVTTSWKVRLVAARGVVRLGVAVLAPVRLTAGPAVCVQA